MNRESSGQIAEVEVEKVEKDTSVAKNQLESTRKSVMCLTASDASSPEAVQNWERIELLLGEAKRLIDAEQGADAIGALNQVLNGSSVSKDQNNTALHLFRKAIQLVMAKESCLDPTPAAEPHPKPGEKVSIPVQRSKSAAPSRASRRITTTSVSERNQMRGKPCSIHCGYSSRFQSSRSKRSNRKIYKKFELSVLPCLQKYLWMNYESNASRS